MVLIIQEPRAHQPEGQEIVPFEDLVDFGDGEKNVAFLIKKTYEKKAHRGKANLIQAPEKFGKAIRMQAELFPADPPSEPFELTAGAAPFVVLSYCDDTDGADDPKPAEGAQRGGDAQPRRRDSARRQGGVDRGGL